ncbi:heterokaryon incompatibility protein-domain-containing protein [Hyaloscypha finlandica]|nr:heterokaryon incompatibility protein-domain-containing protein [Hyaloscypha finlandica]
MRLIDTKTLALKEFFGNQIPRYAILSHTWQEEEVSFQDWADQSSASQKKGYKKIFDTCQLAKKHGYDYVWVDTNCIDKSSSSELTEAINSMFKWYQSAQVCYAYLSDVPSSEAEEFSMRFRNSRWFSRGWTLQELLAPRDVEFYSNDWSLLGTKKSLSSDISTITGINIRYLWKKYLGDYYIGDSWLRPSAQIIEYIVPLRKASVGERFSWLSNRTTTRPEDMAYCMLGIFELNMPLLYGEGPKAFTRLQEEIMKVSDDHSLFCWTWDRSNNRGGFLSEVPSEFMYAGRFVPRQEDKRPAPYTFTNAGLSIRLPILNCWHSSFIGILRVDSFQTGIMHFKSPLPGKIFGLPMSGDLETGRVCRIPYPPEPIPLADGVSGSQEFSVFVSENYSQQHSYHSPMHSSISTKQVRSHFPVKFAVLLTFGQQHTVLDIKTRPPDRFNPLQSLISIYPNSEWDPTERIEFRFIDYQRTYEGVLVQLELKTGEFESFMIASTRVGFREDEEIDTRWRWHHWRVSQEDASTIMSGELEGGSPVLESILWRVSPEDAWTVMSGELGGGSPVLERVHRAIKDPNYAQILL